MKKRGTTEERNWFVLWGGRGRPTECQFVWQRAQSLKQLPKKVYNQVCDSQNLEVGLQGLSSQHKETEQCSVDITVCSAPCYLTLTRTLSNPDQVVLHLFSLLPKTGQTANETFKNTWKKVHKRDKILFSKPQSDKTTSRLFKSSFNPLRLLQEKNPHVVSKTLTFCAHTRPSQRALKWTPRSVDPQPKRFAPGDPGIRRNSRPSYTSTLSFKHKVV